MIKELPESLGDMGPVAMRASGPKVFVPMTVSEGGVDLGDALEVLSFEGLCHGSHRQNAQNVLHFVDPLILRAALGKLNMEQIEV